MSDPNEADLLSLIGAEESMTLEFKRGDVLDKEPKKVAEELSREVSAFANALGGRIIVGMEEGKNDKRGVARALTGVSNPTWTSHRLQQLVESNIEPPLRLRFFRVALPSVSPQARAFVIDVPQGTTAHQAMDCRYYARSEYEVKALRDYEIRLRMNRSTALTAQVEVRLALRRSAQALQNEQLEDYLADVAGLRSGLTGTAEHSPEHGTLPRPPSITAWSTAEKQILLQDLIPRARFDEIGLTIGMRNLGERTIREYDMQLYFDHPPGWSVVRRQNVQPRGGFSTTDEAHATKLAHDEIVSDARWHVSHRLLPGASTIVRKYVMLIPERALLTGLFSTLRWAVHLDNSPPSRGEIDLLPELQSILYGQPPTAS